MNQMGESEAKATEHKYLMAKPFNKCTLMKGKVYCPRCSSISTHKYTKQ